MDTVVLDSIVACKMCGENVFNEKDGFYYCDECGTKSDHVRAVEVVQDEEYDESTKHAKKQKIAKEETTIPALTSWECYNYILRGLVDELLSFGVKEEIKLMVLQVWASLLRRKQVAFFNKTQPELPKLGVRYLQRDARTLYNHQKKQRSRHTSASSITSAKTNDSVSKRDWRKSKRNLDASGYSIYSSESTKHSSSTGGTSGVAVLKLEFSNRARKYYKKQMSLKHLEKHAKDADGSMTCHRMPRANDLNRIEYASTLVNIKQLYAILAIALNLVQDDVQFSDLVRFIAEDNILGMKNVIKYFPENVAPKTKELLREIKFYTCPSKYSYKNLHTQVGILARFLKINCFKKPDMINLTRRFVTELGLPKEMVDYIQRLMTLIAPKMHTRLVGSYPHYEARVMAYIIFVLKLFFGLDGHKEQSISAASININEKLKTTNSNNIVAPAQLFVWSEWLEYVEMRKVILSQYNTEVSKQYKQQQSITQKIAQLGKRFKNSQEEQTDYTETVRSQVNNLQHIMEMFLQHSCTNEAVKSPIFPATLTPVTDYFNIIKTEVAPSLPEFMQIDHSKRTFQPYLRGGAYRHMQNFLQSEGYQLELKVISCTTQREYLGFFNGKECSLPNTVHAEKADFNITEKEWLQSLKVDNVQQELFFQKQPTTYCAEHLKRLQKKNRKLKGRKKSIIQDLAPAAPTEYLDVKTSLEMFSEQNMDPLMNIDLTQPRRQLGSVNIFEGLSDLEEESVSECKTDEIMKNNLPVLKFLTSNFDCWTLLGKVYSLSNTQKNELLTLLPCSLRWLLDTCAQSIYVDTSVVYEELLVIELMFNYGIENLDEFKDCVHLQYNLPVKEINVLMNSYREIW